MKHRPYNRRAQQRELREAESDLVVIKLRQPLDTGVIDSIEPEQLDPKYKENDDPDARVYRERD